MRVQLQKRCWFLTILVLGTLGTAFGQVPADLKIVATAGGVNSFAENRTVVINPDGTALYSRYIPGRVGEAPLEEASFTLSPTDMATLWQSIQDQGFFSMDASFSEPEINGRTFARLLITANGVTHDVRTDNLAVQAFDAIMQVLNGLTPDGQDLEYDTSAYEEIIFRDLCEIVSKAGSADFLAKDNTLDIASSISGDADAHAGTVIASRISLKEAVRRGIVKLEGKGGYFGDKVALEVDNTASQAKDTVTATIYMEFFGTDASAAAVKKVKDAIEAKWGGKTSTSGKVFKVVVEVRRDSTKTTAPGTAGYHQIELNHNTKTSYVTGLNIFDVNKGTGGGNFATTGTKLDETYAHEAGHLLDIGDFYDDYNKQADGTWKLRSDGTTKTAAEFAALLAPKYPNSTQTAILAWLNRDGFTRVAPTHAGHENDLMATLSGDVQQSDIDALVAKAGVVVEVKPGDVLVNKNDSDQNLGVTRSLDLFVKAGEKKTLNGIYTACIDNHDGSPDFGQRYDIGPSLSEWGGIEAAEVLLTFLEYVDNNDLFCDFNPTVQSAIWRITDNENLSNSSVTDLLHNAGIDLGYTTLDFPRLSSPAPNDTTTVILIPDQLFTVSATPDIILTSVDSRVSVSGVVEAPSGNFSVSYTWGLVTPAGSSATLSGSNASIVSFTPDIRGVYVLTLTAEVTDSNGNVRSLDPTSSKIVAADEMTDTFERGTLHTPAFRWTTTEAASWTTSDTDFHSGSFSARSGLIAHGETTSLSITLDVPVDGSISFAHKTSSESGFDKLIFDIDGTAQADWSGLNDWEVATYSLSAGSHILTWVYSKDSSISSGEDRVWIDDVFFPTNATITAIDDDTGQLPEKYDLRQNYPNPFNPITTIGYSLVAPQRVELTVFDVLGREVVVLVKELQPAGHHEVQFDARDLPSGVYLYRLEAGAYSRIRSLVLLK